MKTALQEVITLRNDKNICIDTNNSNRYCIIQKDLYRNIAYCFSTPIYNKSNKLVYRNFEASNDKYIFIGSNAVITAYKNTLIMKDHCGSALISLSTDSFVLDNGALITNSCKVKPTFNGIVFRVNSNSIKLRVSTDTNFVVKNDSANYFALMQDSCRPFLTISPLFSCYNGGQLNPAHIIGNAIGLNDYEIHLFSESGDELSFEINLYEHKLFQDTTVHSKSPNENNVFGGISFLGHTESFGEQWLYSRLDFSKIENLYQEKIKKVLLHIPCLYNRNMQIMAYIPISRFCSFGSTWDNKKEINYCFAKSYSNNNYKTLNITDAFSDNLQSLLINGIVLKTTSSNPDYTVITTGDNYTFPQIIELHY